MELVTVFVMMVTAYEGGPAGQSALHAYVRQTELDKYAEAYAKRLISKEHHATVANIASVSKMIIDRRVTAKWEF